MARVIVNARNYMFADMIRLALRDNGDFHVTVVGKPEKVIDEFNRTAANIVLMEVASGTPWTMWERMALREIIHRIDPHCKIALLVDEREEKRLAEQVVRAKLDGLIDQFIYTSISATYLVALMSTL